MGTRCAPMQHSGGLSLHPPASTDTHPLIPEVDPSTRVLHTIARIILFPLRSCDRPLITHTRLALVCVVGFCTACVYSMGGRLRARHPSEGAALFASEAWHGLARTLYHALRMRQPPQGPSRRRRGGRGGRAVNQRLVRRMRECLQVGALGCYRAAAGSWQGVHSLPLASHLHSLIPNHCSHLPPPPPIPPLPTPIRSSPHTSSTHSPTAFVPPPPHAH